MMPTVACLPFDLHYCLALTDLSPVYLVSTVILPIVQTLVYPTVGRWLTGVLAIVAIVPVLVVSIGVITRLLLLPALVV